MEIEETTGLPVGALVDTKSAPRPTAIACVGRCVRLEPLDAVRHGRDLYALSSGPGTDGLWTYLFDAPVKNVDAFCAMLAVRAISADPLFCAIIDLATGRAVGMASLMRIDEKNRVIEVGNILYTPALQRTVGATEAMYLLMRLVFEELGYRRYEWKCNSLNAPSISAAKRLGFAFEGVFRQHMFVKGRNRDTAWFSMLDGEWPARKAAFEAWLHPDNFNAAGQQKQALAAGAPGEVVKHGRFNLRQAGAQDQRAIEVMQADAYHRNSLLIGAVPVPLQWDYATKLREGETWVIDGTQRMDAVLFLQMREGDMWLDSLAVAPAVQSTGIGKALLEFAHARARQSQRLTIRLATNAKLPRNIQWYQRHGFAIEREEALADRCVVHMVKYLGEA